MTKKKSYWQVATANDLKTGICVFFYDDDSWRPEIVGAAVALTPDQGQDLLARAAKYEADNQVVGVYLVDVNIDSQSDSDFKLLPVAIREKVRVSGPTIVYDTSL